MSCENSKQIQAYYDDALPADQIEQVQAHLRICAECRELLEDLKHLSEMFAAVPLATMTASARNRMYGSFWAAKQASDRAVRKLAGWLTAAAAAIIVIVPLYSPSAPPAEHRDNSAQTNSGTFVDSMAFIAPAAPHDESSTDLVQVAQWFANDLSADQVNDRVQP